MGKKYINDPDLWIETEDIVRSTLKDGNINFKEIPGEALCGPKVDVQVWSAIGKEFTLATNQVDFAHGDLDLTLLIKTVKTKLHYAFIELH